MSFLSKKPVTGGGECPLLMAALSEHEKQQAVAMGRYFTPREAAVLLGIRPGVARSLWGNPTMSVVITRRAAWMAEIAQWCPPDWLPDREDVNGWRGFRNAVEVMAEMHLLQESGPRAFSAPERADVGKVLSAFIRRAGREWTGFLSGNPEFRMQAVDTTHELAFDMLAVLLSKGVLRDNDIVGYDELLGMAASMLHHSRHPAAVARVVGLHHGRLVPEPGGGSRKSTVGWSSLIKGEVWNSPCGGSIHELLNRQELQDEGAALSHCVGGYASTCVSGHGRIMSVRNSDGKRLSTLLVRMHGRERGLVVGQHSAEKNRTPSKEAHAIVREFMLQANRADIVNMNFMVSGSSHRSERNNETFSRTALKHARIILGANWKDPDILQARQERWRAIMDLPPDPLQAIAEHFRRWPWPHNNSPFGCVIRELTGKL